MQCFEAQPGASLGTPSPRRAIWWWSAVGLAV